MNVIVTPAPLWRRIAALVYDVLLLLALLLIATAISTAVANVLSPGLQERAPDALSHHPLHQLWLLLCWFFFYATCWLRSGQTLGMKAWRLRLIDQKMGAITLKQCSVRFFTAFFGLGLIVAIFHSKGFSLQDITSKTQIVLLPKDEKIKPA